MILERIVDILTNKYDIQKEDVEKVKKILGKVKFTKRDGKDIMLVEIGEGIELSIVQKKK